jgi:hypothetical protein
MNMLGYSENILEAEVEQDFVCDGLGWTMRDSLRPAGGGATLSQWLHAIESAFDADPRRETLEICGGASERELGELVRLGVARPSSATALTIERQIWLQCPRRWIAEARAPFPLRHKVTFGRRHPLRNKPRSGELYRRHIPHLGTDVSFRVVDDERDKDLLVAWMNQEEIDVHWNLAGAARRTVNYLSALHGAESKLPTMLHLGDEAIGYVEFYWMKEDRLSNHWHFDDWDRGWHVAIGSRAHRGRQFVSAWLPSLAHYAFLDDCRTQNVFAEPSVTNARFIASLAKSGYSNLRTLQLSDKRASLMTVNRERFFAESLLYPVGGHDAR